MTTNQNAVLEMVRSEDKAGLVRSLLAVFADEPEAWRDEFTLYALMLASRRGTLSGTFEGLMETIETERIQVHRVPSPRNVSRAFKQYGRRQQRDLDEEGDEE